MLIKLIIAGFLGHLLVANIVPAVNHSKNDQMNHVGLVRQEQQVAPKKKNPNNFGLITQSKSVLVIDQKTQTSLLAKQAEIKRPIASITKLMTVLVFLDYHLDWQTEVRYKKEYNRDGSSIILKPGEDVIVKDLFYSALVTSANNAIVALVGATGENEEVFVEKMNQKAKSLGMLNTVFVEPTGLDQSNTSTASDLVILINASLQQEDIVKALGAPSYKFETRNTKIGQWIFNNDYLLNSFLNQGEYQVLAGKTGYTEEAGYCIVAAIEKNKTTLYVVVLGAESEEQRFQEARALAYWAFENYDFF